MYAQHARKRLEHAITAMGTHPHARRRPLPSGKAGRVAMRELGMTRAARPQESSAADAAFIAIGDAVADAYHLAGDYGLPPAGLDALHATRLNADEPFPTGVHDEVIELTYFLGNVLHLGAVAYDFCPEALIQQGLLHFNAERLGL